MDRFGNIYGKPFFFLFTMLGFKVQCWECRCYFPGASLLGANPSFQQVQPIQRGLLIRYDASIWKKTREQWMHYKYTHKYTCHHVCLCLWEGACMYVCLYVCMFVCLYECMHACMDACVHACRYVGRLVGWLVGRLGRYACMIVWLCIYVCMIMYDCVCMIMYVWLCVYDYVCIHACERKEHFSVFDFTRDHEQGDFQASRGA